MIKKIIFLIVFTLMFVSISGVEFNSCQSLISGSYELNTSLTQSGSNCINITSSNIVLDCQGYSISGDSTNYGIFITGNNNIIRNCNIYNFSSGSFIFLTQNNTFVNNTFVNNSQYGTFIGLSTNISFSNNSFFNNPNGFFQSSSNSLSVTSNIFNNNNNSIYNTNSNFSEYVSNTIESSTNFGVVFYSAFNNTFTSNTVSENNGIGALYFDSSSNNTFSLNTITQNNDYNLIFSATSGQYSNLFFSNTLGNISKIDSTDWSYWSNKFNSSTNGNTYYNISGFGDDLSFCFAINNCDEHARIITFPNLSPATISSVFPYGNSIFLLFVILSFFIFN